MNPVSAKGTPVRAGVGVTIAFTNSQSPCISANGISQIECDLYAGSPQHLAAFCHTDNQYLFGAGYGKQPCRAKAHQYSSRPFVGRKEENEK